MKVRARSIKVAFLLAATLPITVVAGPARVPFPPSQCSAVAPAEIRGPSVQWLGPCIGGKADGLGILRIGLREPHAFLIGRMKQGRPASGHVIFANGDYQQAMAFDARGMAIIADGEHMREQDAVWADAVRAARSVAARFAAVGNRASAAYYRRFASRIENGRPE